MDDAGGRVDRLARRLANPGGHVLTRQRLPQPGAAEPVLDGVARALVAPVTRRRAVVLVGGAVVAGSVLRPGGARADARVCPAGTTKCQSAGGPSACMPTGKGLVCCNSDVCAGYCTHPGQICAQDGGRLAHCEDGPGICTDRLKPVFCQQRGPRTGSTACDQPPTIEGNLGWCCGKDEVCGDKYPDCKCNPAKACGDACCKSNEYCEDLGFLRGGKVCLRKCDPATYHRCPPPAVHCCPANRDCDGSTCVCKTGETCGTNCCKAGDACLGGSRCGKPPTPPPSPGPLDFLGNMLGLINQTAGSRGGKHRVRGAAADPAGAALLALAAVDAQAAAAGAAFTDLHVDRAYKRKVVAATPKLPKLAAGPGLDARAARALDTLLAAQAKAFALVLAAATSLARSRAALRKHDRTLARRQALASAAFASQAAKTLRGVPALRAKAAATLTSTGTAEVTATAAQVLALQASVRAGGVPSDLAAQLARLGIRGADLGRVKAALLASSAGGPALIAPLADPAVTRTIEASAAALAKYAKAARRAPIRTYRGEPLRVRGTRAHDRPRRR
jgi:hypothetical protein